MSSTEQDSGFWPSLYAQLRGVELQARECFSPLASAVSDEAEYLIRVELPGMVADAVTVRAQQNSIVIEGSKANPEHGEGVVVFFNERLDGQFMRTFKLPTDADIADFHFAMELGVLQIHVPRRTGVDIVGLHPETAD